MFPTKKDSDSIPVPLASFTGRDPFCSQTLPYTICLLPPQSKKHAYASDVTNEPNVRVIVIPPTNKQF